MELDPRVTEEHGVVAGLLMPDWNFMVVNYHDGNYFYETSVAECQRFMPMKTTFKEIKDAIVSLEEDGYIETIGFTRSMPAENKFKVTTHSKE